MAAAVPLGRGLGRLFSHASGVLKNPQTWLAGCIGCALFMPLTVFADYWGIHYVELLSGTTTARAAAANGMLYVGWLLGSPLAGRLSDHLCRRKPFLVCGCASSSILLLAIISMRHIPLWAVGSLLFLLGLLSSPEVICFTMSGEHNSSGSQGTAIAAVNTVVMLLGGIMQPAVGYILDHCAGRRGESVAIYSIEHFQRAFLVLPVAMAIGLALSLIIRESGKRAMN
jgi:MFS family permease